VEVRQTASRMHRLCATAPLPHILREGLPMHCDGERYHRRRSESMLRRRVTSDVAPLVAFRRSELSPTRRWLANGLTIIDLRTSARRRRPKAVFDHVDGAASEEISLRRARQLYADLQFNRSVLHDISAVDTSTSVLGSRYA
jgi:hypothetical protein